MATKAKEENPNVNCLAGFRCPKCGSYGPFQIAATCWVDVTDAGTGDPTEFEWDEDSPCVCSECKHSSNVGGFRHG